MKQRAKAAHWLSDIFGNPEHLEKRARLDDRKLDNKVGARLRGDRDHRPDAQCDWRNLERINTPEREGSE